MAKNASRRQVAAAEHGVPRTVSRPALLSGGSDREFRELVHRLLAFSANLETIRSRFGATIGLSGVQYTALISIAHLSRDTAVGVSELAEHMGLSGSFATLVVGQLAGLGLVQKSVDATDRRRVRLAVTAAGLDRLRRLAPVQTRVNDLLFAPLDAAQFRALRATFGELIRSAGAAVHFLDYLADGGTFPDESAARRAAE